LTLLSCGQNSFEKKLNGKWFGVENDGLTRFYFYPDSLVYMELNTQTVQWTANETEIKFDLTQQWPYQTTVNDTTSMLIEYFLSNKSKTITFTEVNNSIIGRNFELIRAEDFFDFLSLKSGVSFKLPHDNKIDRIELEERHGLKIFIGNTSKVKPTIISEFGNGMDSINSDIIKFKQNLQPLDGYHKRKLESEFHFRVFADKSISDEEIENLIPEITKSEVKKVFRIYETQNYYNFETLAGKQIKTIANNASYEKP